MFVENGSVSAVPFDGFSRKVLAYGEELMICEVRLKEGACLARHSHPHEQITYVVSGRIIVVAGEEERQLAAGDSISFGSDVPHQVTALEDALVVDCFSPVREDFLK